MARYLQISAGRVVADLRGAGAIDAPHMIPVAEDQPATCDWSWDGEGFSPPPVAEYDRLEAIADRRWRCMTAPLVHNGETIALLDSDTLARLDAQIATMGLQDETTLWEVRRGVFVEMDTADCRALRYALAARIRAAYQRAAVLSAEVLAGGSPDIESGWPV